MNKFLILSYSIQYQLNSSLKEEMQLISTTGYEGLKLSTYALSFYIYYFSQCTFTLSRTSASFLKLCICSKKLFLFYACFIQFPLCRYMSFENVYGDLWIWLPLLFWLLGIENDDQLKTNKFVELFTIKKRIHFHSVSARWNINYFSTQ